jgi:hypothetical protein
MVGGAGPSSRWAYARCPAEYDQARAECDKAMELFSSLPDRESLTIERAAQIEYRQGSELARKWLLRIHRVLASAAIAERRNWQEMKPGSMEAGRPTSTA